MRITFSTLDSIPCRSHEIASEYRITWPRQCLPYATFENESDLDHQDRTKKVIFKIKIVPMSGGRPTNAHQPLSIEPLNVN